VASDYELLARWADSDAAAGNQLFGRYFDGLFRFFATKVDDEVDDLVQGTLLDCVKYRSRLGQADDFKAYLYKIARHRLYRHFGAKARSGDVDFGVSSVIDLGSSPSSIIAQREEERRLLVALRGLPVELQILLELHYWETMTIEHAANVLEMPVGTAKSRLRRAKRLLRERLSGLPSEGPDQALDELVTKSRLANRGA